jgi:hypothetical protein
MFVRSLHRRAPVLRRQALVPSNRCVKIGEPFFFKRSEGRGELTSDHVRESPELLGRAMDWPYTRQSRRIGRLRRRDVPVP